MLPQSDFDEPDLLSLGTDTRAGHAEACAVSAAIRVNEHLPVADRSLLDKVCVKSNHLTNCQKFLTRISQDEPLRG